MRAPRQMILSMLGIALVAWACSPQGGDMQRQFSDMKIGDSLVWQKIKTDKPNPPSLVVSGEELVFHMNGFFAGHQVVSGDAYSRIVLPGHSSLPTRACPSFPR